MFALNVALSLLVIFGVPYAACQASDTFGFGFAAGLVVVALLKVVDHFTI